MKFYLALVAGLAAAALLILYGLTRPAAADPFTVVERFQTALQHGNFGDACDLYSDAILGYSESAYRKQVEKHGEGSLQAKLVSRDEMVRACAANFVANTAYNMIVAGYQPLLFGSLVTDPRDPRAMANNVLEYRASFFGHVESVGVQRDRDGDWKIAYIK